MQMVTRGGFFRGLRRAVVASGFGVLLSLGALAQTLPEPPVNSDIAIRLLPVPEGASNVDRTILLRHPLMQMVRRVGMKSLKWDPVDFIQNTFEGTAIAAIVSQDGESSLQAFAKDQGARDAWTSNTDEIRSLATDLGEHFEGQGEPYPEDLTQYLEETRYYEPYLHDGVSYRYQRLDEGKDFRLTMAFEEDSELAALGEPPVFTGSGENKNLHPTAAPKPLNLVLGIKLKDSKKLASLLDQGLGQRQKGFWSIKEPGQLAFHATIRGDWLVGSDQKSNLGGFLKSLNGEVPGWSANPAFKLVERNLAPQPPFLMFVDTPKLLDAIDTPLGDVEKQFIDLAGPMGYALVPYTESQTRVEVFVGVNAPKESQLSQFLESGRGQTPSASLLTPNIPWDASNVFALEYGNSKELLDSTMALFPEAQAQFDMGQDVFAGMLGLDAEAGFNGLVEGPAIVSFERIDVLLNALESIEDKTAAYTTKVEQIGGPPEEQEETPEVAEPELDDTISRLPATFAFQVPIESNRQTILSMLTPYMGDDVSSTTLYGVEIKTGAEGRLSYAVDQDWVYVSSGRTDRLMRHMLEASRGRKETLSSLDSWSAFSVRSEGKLLAFGHQKMDWIYSIVKGFVLLLGADFRPLANEIGKLRDYHSVMTAVPDGFMLVGEVLQGDGR